MAIRRPANSRTVGDILYLKLELTACAAVIAGPLPGTSDQLQN